MLCRADPDACIGVNSTTFRTGTEHLCYMAWSCKKQRRNSDCGCPSTAERNFHRCIKHGGRRELFSCCFAGRKVQAHDCCGWNDRHLRADYYFELGLSSGSDHSVEKP